MANSKVRVLGSVFPTDTSTFDITVGGESRNPTACIVMCTVATALSTTVNDASISCGMTDFTDVAAVAWSTDDAEGAATDTSSGHTESLLVELLDAGTSTALRTATGAAISGGVRLTPGQSGVAYRVIVILFFGASAKMFSSNGDGNMAINETFTIAHGLGVKANAGIYFSIKDYLASTAHAEISLGFHVDNGSIEQNCAAFNAQHFVDPSRAGAQIRSSAGGARCSMEVGGTGNEVVGYELTTNDATNCIYTNRVAAQTENALVGLLFDFDDVSVDLDIVNTPITAASDWNYNGLSFQSQIAIGCMTHLNLIDGNEQGGDAGTFGFFAFDEDGEEHVASCLNEDNVAIDSDTSSRVDANLFLRNDDNTADVFDLTNPVFTTDGFDVAAGDITTMDGTIRKWPMLFIGEAAGSSIVPIVAHRRKHILGVG